MIVMGRMESWKEKGILNKKGLKKHGEIKNCEIYVVSSKPYGWFDTKKPKELEVDTIIKTEKADIFGKKEDDCLWLGNFTTDSTFFVVEEDEYIEVGEEPLELTFSVIDNKNGLVEVCELPVCGRWRGHLVEKNTTNKINIPEGKNIRILIKP